ncbi:type II secretion system minor pseudopilin GspJ [Saliniradius amylolyticus]
MTNRGFTLIEILLAMAIFSLIGLASYSVLSTVLDSDRLSSEQFEAFEKLQRTMLYLERDLLQAVPRSVRIEGQGNDIVFSGGEDQLQSDADGMAFVRGGWHNPQLMLPRSRLQAVGYRLRDGKLERLHHNYPDNVIGHEPEIRVLLERVEDLQLQFATAPINNDRDSNTWSNSYTATELPMAVAVELTTEDFGMIRREFLLTGKGGTNAITQ